MGELKKLAEEKKIKVLKKLMSDDRIEITHPGFPSNPIMFYFKEWKVIDGIIIISKEKLGETFPLVVNNINIEITKLIPTR